MSIRESAILCRSRLEKGESVAVILSRFDTCKVLEPQALGVFERSGLHGKARDVQLAPTDLLHIGETCVKDLLDLLFLATSRIRFVSSSSFIMMSLSQKLTTMKAESAPVNAVSRVTRSFTSPATTSKPCP